MLELNTHDGLRLHPHHWPATAAPHGRVLIVHGLGEHGGRYAATAAVLNRAGWEVLAYDQRGHGRSGGARGALARADDLLVDMAMVLDALAADGPPPVLLGHSMGGAVAARFVAEALAPAPAPWSRPLAALVLSSPALEAGLSLGQKLQLALGHALAPGLAVGNGLQPQWVSRDPAVVDAYVADPLVHDRITPRLARFILDAGQQVRAAAPRWALPTLLMWAGADRCVLPAGAAAFAAAAPASVLQARRFDGLAHEIFNEPEAGQVLAHLVGWLAAR